MKIHHRQIAVSVLRGMDVSVVYIDSVVCSVVVDKSLKSDRTYGFCALVLRIGFTHSLEKHYRQPVFYWSYIELMEIYVELLSMLQQQEI